MQRNNHILFGAGGTGGHLYPAIAVANALQKIDSTIKITFAGRPDKIEAKVVPQYGFDFLELDIIPPILKANLNTFLFPIKLIRAVEKCKKFILKNNVKIVVCAGAYISIPPGIASKKANAKLALMESNINPGKAINYLANRADVIFTAFEQTKVFFSDKITPKIVNSGNPVRDTFLNFPSRNEAMSLLGLSSEKLTLLVFGGSLGATSINYAVKENLSKFIDLDINIIWQTGDKNSPVHVNEPNIKIMPYIDDMASAFSAADLIISRSGATTVAELMAAGKPSILVPLPTASTGEQKLNAEFMQSIGASLIIDDSDLKSNLYDVVKDIIFDSVKLIQMSNNARKYSRPDAAKNIAGKIFELIND